MCDVRRRVYFCEILNQRSILITIWLQYRKILDFTWTLRHIATHVYAFRQIFVQHKQTFRNEKNIIRLVFKSRAHSMCQTLAIRFYFYKLKWHTNYIKVLFNSFELFTIVAHAAQSQSLISRRLSFESVYTEFD